MDDLSLHVLDIVENAIAVDASHVAVRLIEDRADDVLTLEIVDDGRGMDPETRARALDPFYTTKPGKRVGLGLPLLAQSAREADGELSVESRPGLGTTIRAVFRLSHIDRRPLGDMATTMRVLEATHPEIEFSYVKSVVKR